MTARKDIALFFWTARERERIRLARAAGQPAPWTDDPVLASFYFCNVNREHDKVTMWLRKNVTRKLARASDEHVITAVAGFRWFNKIETGELLLPMLLERGWHTPTVMKLLAGQRQIFGGAYIIMPAPGKDTPKVQAVCDVMDCLKADVVANVARSTRSLQTTHMELMTNPGMGPFTAYEVITDLRHTKVLRRAKDIMSWANPGPGCVRGLQWLFPDFHITRRTPLTHELMADLLAMSQQEENWPADWPAWEMRTVEHWLCEFDKYCRGCAGTHLKRRYRT